MANQYYIELTKKKIEGYSLVPSDSKPEVKDNGEIITVSWPIPNPVNNYAPPTLKDDYFAQVEIDEKTNQVIRIIAPR